ncbi:hypothetical protein MnTg02_00403 [bacterium MnTg02]|nr:hypothetical protein MnTg02_00403 [bacterium MnTg02]
MTRVGGGAQFANAAQPQTTPGEEAATTLPYPLTFVRLGEGGAPKVRRKSRAKCG